MSHVVLYQDADGERVEEFDGVASALARLQELHESGNGTGRVYGEVPVTVETVVKVTLGGSDNEGVMPPPPSMASVPAAPTGDNDAEPESPRSRTGIDFVAPST